MRIPGIRLAAALALAATIALPVAAGAQQGTPVTGSIVGTVTVLGRGSVQVVPDTATVQIGVSVQQETLDGALNEANDTMTAITQAMTDLGIEGKDIQTANFSVYAVRNYETASSSELPPVIGYNVTNQVAVTIRDVEWTAGLPSDRVGEVIAGSIEAGANDIYGISFAVEDTSAAETEARAMAVANAGERAAELAAAAGKDVGEVIAISEGVTFSPIGYTKMDGAQGAGDGGVPIFGGVVEIAIEVNVTYELS